MVYSNVREGLHLSCMTRGFTADMYDKRIYIYHKYKYDESIYSYHELLMT